MGYIKSGLYLCTFKAHFELNRKHIVYTKHILKRKHNFDK